MCDVKVLNASSYRVSQKLLKSGAHKTLLCIHLLDIQGVQVGAENPLKKQSFLIVTD